MKAKIVRGSGFEGALKYVFNGRKHEHKVKNARVVGTNMSGKNVPSLAAEFGDVRRLRSDIEKPVWHTSLSLPVGETLTDAKWEEVVRDFLVEMKIDPDNHQYIAVQHGDTEHQHVHIILNRIGLDQKMWHGRKDVHAAIAATQVLELKHGLKITKGLTTGDDQALDQALSNGEQQESNRTGADAKRIQLAGIIRLARDSSKTFPQFVGILHSNGVDLAPNGKSGNVGGASFSYKGTHYTGTKVGKDCTWKAIAEAVNYDPVADAQLVAELRASRETAVQVTAETAVDNLRKKTADEVIDVATQNLFSEKSVTTMDRFEVEIGEIRNHLPEYAKEAESELRTQLAPLGKDESGTPVFTTTSILECEAKAIRSAQLLATDSNHNLEKFDIDAAITANTYKASNKEGVAVELTPQQRRAIQLGFESGYVNLTDTDGLNTSFALGCLRVGYEQQEYQVLGAAAAASATDFERETGIESRTVAKLLSDIHFNKVILDRKTLIVLDDVARLDPKSVADVMALCDKHGAKLVTTGADRLHTVSKGSLPTNGPGQMATEVLMQNDPDYFVKTFGTGPDEGLRAKRDAAMDAPLEDEDGEAPIETFDDALQKGMTDLYGRESAVTLDRVEEAMMDLEQLAPQFADRVSLHIKEQLQACGVDDGGRELFTTKEILDREHQMIRDVRTMALDVHHDLSEFEIRAAIQKKEEEASRKIGRTVTMTEEQRLGVAYALKGGYAALQGSAGAGKSFAMEAVKIGYQERGYTVLGAAVSRRASQNLQDETGIKSYTVAKMLSDIKRGNIVLNEKTCLVVDEAGQVGTGYLSSLVRQCSASGAKIVFTGEDKQLDAIQHGGVLRFLSRDDIVGTARIQNIQRQDEAWAKQAVADYRDGRMDAGLQAFESRGLVTMKRGGAEATQESLVKNWRKFELDALAAHAADPSKPMKQSLILAHSNVSARALGELVRDIRKKEGVVTGPEFTLKAAHGEKVYQLTMAAGDRVRFNKNDEGGVGVINGSLGTVLSITEVPGSKKGIPDYLIRALTDDRGEVEFKASEYADEKGRLQMGQAYAMTVYASQGVTVNGDVFVLQTGGMDRANTYVAHSRAKGNTHTYVDRDALAAGGRFNDSDEVVRERLVASMSRESSKRMATEYLALADEDYIQNTFGEHKPDEARRARFAEVVKVHTEDEKIREQFRQEELAKKDKGTFITTEVRPGILAPATSAKSPGGGPMPLARPRAMEPAKSNAARSGHAPRPS